MKLFLLIIISFVFINNALSQNVIEIKIEVGRKRKITKVDVEGVFPDGDTTLGGRIAKSLNTSVFVKNRIKRGNYTVRVIYVVTKDGSISDIQCENDPGYGMCQEAVRAVKKSPKWTPGPVRVRM